MKRGRMADRWRGGAGSVAIALVALGAGVAPAYGQEGGVIGRVINAETGQPLIGAQVVVRGTEYGTVTNEQGAFLLPNLPAGAYELEADLIGYRAVRQSATVAAGQTVRLEFELEVSAVALDEVVVSGRSAETAQREIGASVKVINVAEELEAAPVSSVSEILQDRIPGLYIQEGSGTAGHGSRIVMRGIGTMTGDNVQPLIYVDGVRMDNSNTSEVSGTAASWAGIDDLDPADIDRIETVKGAAAATLYGSEAGSGVIHIFTKQGQGDGQTYNVSTRYGVSNTPRDYWDVSIYAPWFYDQFVQNGQTFRHNASISGMLDGFSYRMSGSWRGDDGVLPDSYQRGRSFRANMRFTPSDKFWINVNSGYYWRQVRYPEQGDNRQSYALNGLQGGPRGIHYVTEDLISARERIANMGRFTASTSMAWTPIEQFEQRATFGAEVTNWDTWRYEEYGSEFDENGEMYNHRRETITLNVDYTARLLLRLTPTVESNTAFGFQAFSKEYAFTRGTANNFPGPGLRSIRAGGDVTGYENHRTVLSAGYFGEQQFGFDNLLFVTFGLRADGHSAFGESVGYTLYPKMDMSYVISDQGFWPEPFGTLRLRAAYGTAGRQPGAYDAERTWDVVEGGVNVGNIGNDSLKPEISHEFEAGFDLSLLGERLSVEYTHYRQRTEDALYNVVHPPSLGFIEAQRTNVGEIRNVGHELAVNMHFIQRRGLRWSGDFTFFANDNEVTSLNGAPQIDVGWSQWIREGYPVGAFFDNRYVMQDGEPVWVEDDYIGQPLPKSIFTFGTKVGIGGNLTLSATMAHKRGHHISSSTTRLMSIERVRAGEPFYDPEDPSTAQFEPGRPVANWCIDPTDPILELICTEDWTNIRGNHIWPADLWRLREVSLRYNLPRDLARRVGASRGYVTLSGRNLWRHQTYPGTEASADFYNANEFSNQSYFDTPVARQVIAGLSLTF